MILRCTLFAFALSATALLGQDSKPSKGASKPSAWAPSRKAFERGPFARMSFAGPAAVKQSILPTNFGSLLTGPECGMVWIAARTFLRNQVRMSESEDADRAFRTLEEELLDYSGRIDIDVSLDLSEDESKDPTIRGLVVLWSDDEIDLPRLCGDVRKVLTAAAGTELQSVRIGDAEFEFFAGPGGDGVSVPHAIGGGHIALAFGSNVAATLPSQIQDLRSTLQSRDRVRSARKPNEILSVEYDLQQWLAFMEEQLPKDSFGGMIRRLYGFPSWDKIRVDLSTSGPLLQLDASVDFLNDKRGLLGAFLPDISKLPDVAQATPDAGGRVQRSVAVGHVRWTALYASMIDFIANLLFFGEGPRDIREVKKDVNSELGFDVEKDLLAHAGTGVLVVLDSAGDDDPNASEGYPDGLCLAFEVANPKAFEKVVEGTLEKDFLALSESETFASVEIYSGAFDRSGGVMHLAHANEHVLWSIGPRGLAAMKRFLKNEKPTKSLEAMRTVRRAAPPGWNFASRIPLNLVSTKLANDLIYEIAREFDRRTDPADVRDALARVLSVLTKYRLDSIYLLGGWEDLTDGRGRARARIIL